MILPDDGVLTVAPELGELERVRHWLDRLLADAGVGTTDRADLGLATSEALSNVVRHTFAGATGSIEITVSIDGDVVTVVIVDDGPTWDGRRRDPKPDGSGGYGLGLMNDVMDVVRHDGLKPAGNRMTLVKRVLR